MFLKSIQKGVQARLGQCIGWAADAICGIGRPHEGPGQWVLWFSCVCLFSRLKFLVGETQDGTVKFFIMKSERFRFDIVFHFRKLSSPPREHSLIRLVFAESGKSSYRWSCATWPEEGRCHPETTSSGHCAPSPGKRRAQKEAREEGSGQDTSVALNATHRL